MIKRSSSHGVSFCVSLFAAGAVMCLGPAVCNASVLFQDDFEAVTVGNEPGSPWTIDRDGATAADMNFKVVNRTDRKDGNTGHALTFLDDDTNAAGTASVTVSGIQDGKVTLDFDFWTKQGNSNSNWPTRSPYVGLQNTSGDPIGMVALFDYHRLYAYGPKKLYDDTPRPWAGSSYVNHFEITYDNTTGEMTLSNTTDPAANRELNDTVNIGAGLVDNGSVQFALSTAYGNDGDTTHSGLNAFDNVQISTVPEPATLAVLGAGSLLLIGRRRRRA